MKWFWWLVAIIIIALGIWYFAGQQSVATSPTNTATITTSTTTTSADIIPGVPNQTYTDSHLSFSIQYPSTASSSQVDFEGYLPLTQTPVVSFVLPRGMFQGTNLTEAGVYIGATTTPKAMQQCTQAQKDLDETATSSVLIGGQQFAVFTSTGVGAGNIYDEKVYRTIQNGQCLEIAELLHSGNIGNYTPGTVKEFDRAEFGGILDRIVQTYQPIPTGQ